MALLVVLLLLSVTLGLSYAAMRSQTQQWMIHRNAGRRASARQAAATGLTMALKRMHGPDWEGVDSTYTGQLSDEENFEVTYTTGDPSFQVPEVIDWDHPDFDDPFYDYPYRVTLLSTGYAADPDHPASIATYQVRAVVRLVPRALGTEPSSWETVEDFTLLQYSGGDFYVNVPCRIEGKVRIQGYLGLSRSYSWPYDVRRAYLHDLERMRTGSPDDDGQPRDYRPFSGPLYLPYGSQDSETLYLLHTLMNVSLVDAASQTFSGTNSFGALAEYRLYPGGKVYSWEVIGQDQHNANLQPDPQSNPLGVFRCTGDLKLDDNVTIRGTLLIQSDVRFYGDDIRLLPQSLPPLEDDGLLVRLPTAVSGDDFRVYENARVEATGLLATADDFEVVSDYQHDIELSILGHVIAKDVYVHGRREWTQWTDWWEDCYNWYRWMASMDPAGTGYFPDWLEVMQGRDPEPRLKIQPPPTAARYHWKTSDDPIYVPGPDDEGLRWELLEWTENP
ncbi:MAG: hypothetical protein JXB62_23570 [Pirellulales bacterium]|nr:hypothetical protein [Pirellulales bacterium]